jgi:hypothetical protein
MNWQNALLMIGGIALNAAVFSMMMRPLGPPKKPEHKPRTKNIIDRIKEQSKLKAKRNR